MISSTLIEKLEQLSPELQKKIEISIEDILKIKNGSNVDNLKFPYTLVIGNEDLFDNANISVKKNSQFDIKPGFGGAKGFFGEMSDDFDAPIDGMKDYM